MEWNGMEWNGMEWNGMEWIWNAAARAPAQNASMRGRCALCDEPPRCGPVIVMACPMTPSCDRYVLLRLDAMMMMLWDVLL
jgi:hypothetical protein